MNGLKVQLPVGWKLVEPRSDAPDLLVERGGRLRHLRSDFECVHDFGRVGPVECPLAYDPKRRIAFRYVCAAGFPRSDFSQLRAFALDRGETFPLLDLPLNQWVLWLLEWIDGVGGEAGRLFGLHAADRPSSDRVVIEHRLFAHALGEDRLQLRPICRDAYKPLAFSRQRKELIFAGAEGIYLLGLKGERLLTLPSDLEGGSEGAAFDPFGVARVVLGGDGLHMWDLRSNQRRRLTRNGRYPTWSLDGKGIWFRESSSDVLFYDLETDTVTPVASLGAQRHPEFWYARPVNQSRCGRFLAFTLTQKQLRGVSRKANATGSREKVFVHEHLTCILDLAAREMWTTVGAASQLRWVD